MLPPCSKSTVEIQLVLHPCNPFFINKLNMTANSVEKHCFAALNVNLQVKTRVKTFYWFFELLLSPFALNSTTSAASFYIF